MSPTLWSLARIAVVAVVARRVYLAGWKRGHRAGDDAVRSELDRARRRSHR